MPDVDSLIGRIDAEFSAVEERINQRQFGQLEEYKARQKRLGELAAVFDRLRQVWKPRLDVLVKKFGDRVQVTPRLTPSTREATFEFQSKLARIRLRFSASTDASIQNVILGYHLEMTPALMRFPSHSEVEFPVQAVDPEAAAKWIDDRIVDFVQTYLALNENDMYLKEHMVEDPVVHVRFPKYAAGATLEWQGKKYYFVDEETCRDFEKQKGIGSK